MGRRKKEEIVANLTEDIIPDIVKEAKVEETTNLENNLHALEEMKVFAEKFPDMKLGQLFYNVSPKECITMGDLIRLDGAAVLETLKTLRRKRLKDTVTYGDSV